MEILCIFCLVVLFRYAQTVKTSFRMQQHPAWEYLSQIDCGNSVSDRIVGGHTAELGQWPWIARLGYSSPYEGVQYLCGGSLISHRIVVTAAHCVQQDEWTLTTIRFGEHDINTDPDCRGDVCAPPVQDVPVSRIYIHECFNNPPFQNDIALVELMEPVQITDYASPVCLPLYAEHFNALEKGDSVAVAGWGKMNMTTSETAEKLQYLYITVMDLEFCANFKEYRNMTTGTICAGGDKNKDSCTGDSGGPLTKVYDFPEGPKHVLVGVVSFGPTICGSGKLPGIYASTSYFMPWILNKIASIENLWRTNECLIK